MEPERAKELFMQYSGNRFYMDIDGVRQEYDSYRVPRETEEEWRREYLSRFFEQKRYGRDAFLSYSRAVDFLKSDMTDDCREKVLYHPLRADWLDDVTILFMLKMSFRLAEKLARKGKLSRDAAAEYRHELDGFVQNVLKRAETGTLTRAQDYQMQEFADAAYAAAYLKDLQQKWTELSFAVVL